MWGLSALYRVNCFNWTSCDARGLPLGVFPLPAAGVVIPELRVAHNDVTVSCSAAMLHLSASTCCLSAGSSPSTASCTACSWGRISSISRLNTVKGYRGLDSMLAETYQSESTKLITWSQATNPYLPLPIVGITLKWMPVIMWWASLILIGSLF